MERKRPFLGPQGTGTVMWIPALPWKDWAESQPMGWWGRVARQGYPEEENTLEEVAWGLAYLTSC